MRIVNAEVLEEIWKESNSNKIREKKKNKHLTHEFKAMV